MKQLLEYLGTSVDKTDSFVLNMNEIDYDGLIEFLEEMKKNDEKYLLIEKDSNDQWFGYSTNAKNGQKYNKYNIGFK